MEPATSSHGLDELVACHDCDLLHRREPLERGERARCSRCNAFLYRRPKDMLHRTLAYTAASLVLFLVANAFPFMEFKIAGRTQVGHMITGAAELWGEGYAFLSFMVIFTSVIAPLFMILCLGYLTAPLIMGWRPPGMITVNRLIGHIQPWSMMEVYMLGVIVSVIKLGQMADIVLGPAAWAFAGLMFTLTAAIAIYDSGVIWERLDADAGKHHAAKRDRRLTGEATS